jgi:hypothetical protein
MKIQLSFGVVSLFFFGLIFTGSATAQVLEAEELEEEILEESEEDEVLTLSNLPYFLDDLMLIAGLNSSNVYWSNHFRELRSAGGFNIGVEGFLPLGQVSFIDFGIHFAQRNFRHGDQNLLFKNNYIDVPIYASFMLPELRSIDWRFFLGTQFSYRVSSNQSEDYFALSNDIFQYDIASFNRFDTGMTFGLSGESGNFFFRVRSFVGISRIDRNDQGGMSAFFIEGGYFLFRGLRR